MSFALKGESNLNKDEGKLCNKNCKKDGESNKEKKAKFK